MLFTESIQSWRDWGRVFQSIPAFTPWPGKSAAGRDCPGRSLRPHPGTNGVFRCREAVLKIFFPKESGLDPALDFSTELAAAQQAASWGVPTPPVLAHGCLQDKYRFYYIATQYSPGKEAGPWLRDATPAQQAAFVERLRQLLPQLHRPTQALPRRDLRQEARGIPPGEAGAVPAGGGAGPAGGAAPGAGGAHPRGPHRGEPAGAGGRQLCGHRLGRRPQRPGLV